MAASGSLFQHSLYIRLSPWEIPRIQEPHISFPQQLFRFGITTRYQPEIKHTVLPTEDVCFNSNQLQVSRMFYVPVALQDRSAEYEMLQNHYFRSTKIFILTKTLPFHNWMISKFFRRGGKKKKELSTCKKTSSHRQDVIYGQVATGQGEMPLNWDRFRLDWWCG